MSQGLAKAPEEITKAPTMYQDIEQGENVARGCASVIEVIPYDITKEPRRHPPDRDRMEGDIMKDKNGNTLYVEIPRKPLFCQDPEDVTVFTESNPKVRVETFTIQIRKTTAKNYIDSEYNMKSFGRIQ